MKDLKDLNINDIYRMMQERTIDLSTLSIYISTILPSKGLDKDDLRKFLEVVNEYVDKVKENAKIDQKENKNEEVVFQQVAVNENKPNSQNDVKTSQGLSDNSINDKKESHQEAMDMMRSTSRYCQDVGMNVKELALDGRYGKGPYISFEINNKSKPMLDHLMSEFYQNNDGVSLEFRRSLTTKDETFTIAVDPKEMEKDKFDEKIKETFKRIKTTVEETKMDYDYEEKMPSGLKNIKNHFKNDDPDIGDDFTIGYVRNDGKDSYYIVAKNYSEAVQYAKSIGYDIKNAEGVNIFEINANGNLIDTKLDDAAIDLMNDKDAQDVRDVGVSNLDIYGNLNTDPKVEIIKNFIETGNDPHIMCLLEIEVPAANPNQRIVRLKSSGSNSEVVVFPNGDDFDKTVLPQIVDTYAENNPVREEDITTNRGNLPDSYSCRIESENNTTLYMDGYTEAEVAKVTTEINNKTKESTDNEKNKANQKTLGQMPNQTSSNNDESDNSSAFISMPVLIIICVLFLLLVTLIVFSV